MVVDCDIGEGGGGWHKREVGKWGVIGNGEVTGEFPGGGVLNLLNVLTEGGVAG